MELAKERGLNRGSKNNFWVAIRNPIYCGKIFIPKFKDEESRFVEGQHEPLISEALFYDVQDVLNGRKKIQRTKLAVDNILPLRGFLICPKCGRMLTGIASKGRNQHYHYYHCSSTCGIRFTAKTANDHIVDEIKKYVRPHPKLQLYKEILVATFKSKTRLLRDEVKQVSVQLDEVNKRLSKARDLLLTGDLDADDYRTIKSESEEKIHRLEAKLTASVTETTDIEPLLNKAISNISQLDVLYTSGSITQKRKIIGSMFPEKLIFDKLQYRTPRVNEAINIMCLIDTQIGSKKNGTSLDLLDLSQQVNWLGLEPRTPSLKVMCSTN